MTAQMDLRKLKHASLLAQDLSFSKAAQRAHLSQPAFGRSIKSLEEELGFELFDRHTRSVLVTPAGARFLAQARELLALEENMRSDALDIAGGEGGELHFGASLLAIDGFLHQRLAQLQNAHPKLRLKVAVSQWQVLLTLLNNESIEFFVAHPDILAQSLKYKVTLLAPQPASIFCRAGHPLLQGRGKIANTRLADYPWACVQMTDAMSHALRPALGLAHDQALPISLECDNQLLLRDAVLQSDRLLLTWSSWLAPDLKAKHVVDLSPRVAPNIPAHLLCIPCAVVQLAGRTLSPAARRFVDAIVKG